MEYQYFTCDWVVVLLDDPIVFLTFVTAISKMDCSILIKEVIKNSDNYYIIRFVFRVPSEEIFDTCLDQAKAFFEFTNCTRVFEASFEGDAIFPLYRVANNILYISKLGQHNKGLFMAKHNLE